MHTSFERIAGVALAKRLDAAERAQRANTDTGRVHAAILGHFPRPPILFALQHFVANH
jgi:hypothetical protein